MMQLDGTILDGIEVPAGVNLQLLQDNIILECAELEVLYADANFMKVAVSVWSAKELPTWKKLYAAATASYNPIENYNRIENVTESTSDSKSVSSSSSGTGTTQSSGSTLDKVNGYNSETFVNRGQSDRSGVDQTNTSTTGSGTEESAGNMLRQSQVRGNIGVTTSQQMLEQELALVPKLNIYTAITESFKRRFCLLIY